MDAELSRRLLDAFRKRFGEAHYHLLAHAAFPLVLTPDLLYRLWSTFPRDSRDICLNIPRHAVADILLSPLCRVVGHELYELDRRAGHLLLQELVRDERFGPPRLQALNRFLSQGAAEQQQTLASLPPWWAKAQAYAARWIASAVLQPRETAAQLAERIKAGGQVGDGLEVEHLEQFLVEQLGEHRSILVAARQGDEETATRSTPPALPEGVVRVRRYEVSPNSLIRALAPSPDGRTLAAACQDGRLSFWGTGTDSERMQIEESSSPLTALAWHPGSRLCVAGADDGRVIFMIPASANTKLLHIRNMRLGAVMSLAFHPKGKRLAVMGVDGLALLPVDKEGAPILPMPKYPEPRLPQGYSPALAWSPDGRLLALADWQGRLHLIPQGGVSPTPTTCSHDKPVLAMAWSSGGTRLASASCDGTVRIWQLRDGSIELVAELQGHQEWVTGVCFDHTGQWLASLGRDGEVRLWDARTWRLVNFWQGNGPPGRVALGGVAFKGDTPAPRAKGEKVRAPSYLQLLTRSHDGRAVELLQVDPKPMPFVWIPGGEFLMGSPENEKERSKDEGPQHLVRLDGLWLGKFPVTQGQWVKVMGSNPAHFQKGDDYPVENVSWRDVQQFIEKLNGQGPAKYRLPSEAEWEYACRAGTGTPFSFGETLSAENQANYDGNHPYGGGAKGPYRASTTAVGSFPANGWGLYDMHGNVWEWVQDVYDAEYYSRSPGENPRNKCSTTEDGYRVLRGGSWIYYARYLRSAVRSRNAPVVRDQGVGFRLVRLPQDV